MTYSLMFFSEREEAYHLQNGPSEKIWGREMNVKKWYWYLDGVYQNIQNIVFNVEPLDIIIVKW